MLKEPLDPTRARILIRRILKGGHVRFSSHAEDEMRKDDMTTVDVENVLRGGVVEPAEFERGAWRYRVRTSRMYVVVAFRSAQALTVVTAWRQ
jgi:Domain of unknown function (DUF4258)